MAKPIFTTHYTEEQLEILNKIVKEEKESPRTVMRAKILLSFDDRTLQKLSLLELEKELGTTHTTIQTTRKEYLEGGIESALYESKRVVSMTNRRINEDIRRQIKELAASEPPAGKKRWSLRMICKECVDRGIVDRISVETVKRILNED